MTFLLLANQCPPPQCRAAFLSPKAAASGANAPVSVHFAAGNTYLSASLNTNATGSDLLGSYGGGAYFLANGLTLSAGTGLNVNVAQGTAVIDGVVTLDQATACGVPASQAHVFIWLLQTGILTYTTGLTPPSTPGCLIGNVTTSSSAVTAVDTSGVLYGLGIFQRQTADTITPTDTPPATLRFVTKTNNSVFYWDGGTYWNIGSSGGSGGGGGYNYRGAYSSGATYAPGDLVGSGGALYLAVSPSTGQSVTNTAYFTLFLPAGSPGATGPAGMPGPVGPQGPAYYNFRGAWSSSTAYAIADSVYDGNVPSTGAYVAILASTGVALTDTAHWTKILPPGQQGVPGPSIFNPRGAYNSGTTYAVNDVVQSSGAAYLAVAASTGQLVSNTSYWYQLIPAAPAGATGQGFTSRGVWSSSTAYAPYDVVTYSGSTYYAVATSTGVTPGTDITKWAVMAAGATGTASAATSSTFGTVETDITQTTPVVYTKTTVDSTFATISSLSTEATNRGNADTTEASARAAGDALALKIASNLSDLASASTARTNLGLGTAATLNVTSATPAAETFGAAAAVGTATTLARADHVHALPLPPARLVLYIPGTLATGVDTLKIPIPSDFSSRAMTRLTPALGTASSSGSVTFTVQLGTPTRPSSSARTAAQTSDTITIASGVLDPSAVTSFTSGITASGGNVLWLNITGAGTGAADLTVLIEF